MHKNFNKFCWKTFNLKTHRWKSKTHFRREKTTTSLHQLLCISILKHIRRCFCMAPIRALQYKFYFRRNQWPKSNYRRVGIYIREDPSTHLWVSGWRKKRSSHDCVHRSMRNMCRIFFFWRSVNSRHTRKMTCTCNKMLKGDMHARSLSLFASSNASLLVVGQQEVGMLITLGYISPHQ